MVAALASLALTVSFTASAADQPVKITIVSEGTFWRPAVVDWIDEVFIPRFNAENPHIEIQPVIRTANWSERGERITSLIAAGMAPDIVVVGHTGANTEGVARGWLLPLDRYLETWDDMEN